MKICIACLVEKDASSFSRASAKSDGLFPKCRDCQGAYYRAYYAANGEKVREKTAAYQKANRAVQRKAKLKWQKTNKEKHLAYRREWHKKKYASDPLYRMNFAIRGCLRRTAAAARRNKVTLGSSRVNFSPEMLRQRIEMNFRPGMSWSNYGDWHIDHRVPVARLIRKGVTDPAKINCLANLAPLWAIENMMKGKR